MIGAIVVAALFGAFIGSFCNVIIHRMPRNESVVTPPSRCYACGTGVCWYDNIPVVSYLVLRGRCRHCGTRFSVRYLLGELAVAAITALAMYLAIRLPERAGPVVWTDLMGWPPEVVAALAAVALCVVAWWLWVNSAIDLVHTMIPDELTKPLQVLAPLLALLAPVGRTLGWQADGWLVAVQGQDLVATPWDGFTAVLWWAVPALVVLVCSLPLARWIYTRFLPEAPWRDEDLRGLRIGVWWFVGATVFHLLVLAVTAGFAADLGGRASWFGAVALSVREAEQSILQPQLQGAAWLVLEAQLATAILGSLCGWLVLYLIGLGGTLVLRRYALGFGDVKLLAPLGAMLGPVGTGYAFGLAALVGTLVGIPWRLCGGGREIPFGPFLAAGAVLAVWFGPQIHDFLFPALSG